jgi:hypothetical protein
MLILRLMSSRAYSGLCVRLAMEIIGEDAYSAFGVVVDY